jgi:RNA polymerase sigma factor (TIGR02999 family)
MSKALASPPPAAAFELSEKLHPEVYGELRALAANHMARGRDQTLQPTVLVHETWLRLAKGARTWRDRGHFFATASVTMRHILIDHARRKARLCRGGGLVRLPSDRLGEIASAGRSATLLQLDEGITELEKVHPERAQVVVDRFFGGLTNREIAARLGIGERSVERHWALAKVWLLRWIQEGDAVAGRAAAGGRESESKGS